MTAVKRDRRRLLTCRHCRAPFPSRSGGGRLCLACHEASRRCNDCGKRYVRREAGYLCPACVASPPPAVSRHTNQADRAFLERPERLARLKKYAALAALELPLFGETPTKGPQPCQPRPR